MLILLRLDGKLHEESSPATLRSIHAKKATLPQESSYQHEDKDLIRDIAAMLKEQSKLVYSTIHQDANIFISDCALCA